MVREQPLDLVTVATFVCYSALPKAHCGSAPFPDRGFGIVGSRKQRSACPVIFGRRPDRWYDNCQFEIERSARVDAFVTEFFGLREQLLYPFSQVAEYYSPAYLGRQGQ